MLNAVIGKLQYFFNKRKDNNGRFKISAVVLCCNGRKYIETRLNSVVSQTLKPFEILFLDDASIDGSVESAYKILKKSKIKWKILKNEENRGCGEQLIKGIHEAKGDFIWFAEQDDYCSKEFLSRMAEMLADKSVALACCGSVPIDEYYRELPYYNDITEKPEQNYCTDGHIEVEERLCIKNTIYNISSVIFRKSHLEGIEPYIRQFKVFFDWMMYVYVLRNGKLAYCADNLNYYMRHSESIIAKYRSSPFFYEDILTVKNYILDHYKISKKNRKSMLREIDKAYEQCGCHECDIPCIADHPTLGPEYLRLQEKAFRLGASKKVPKAERKK